MGKIKKTTTETWTIEPEDDEDLLVELVRQPVGAVLVANPESSDANQDDFDEEDGFEDDGDDDDLDTSGGQADTEDGDE
jgi:hypothetical protein